MRRRSRPAVAHRPGCQMFELRKAVTAPSVIVSLIVFLLSGLVAYLIEPAGGPPTGLPDPPIVSIELNPNQGPIKVTTDVQEPTPGEHRTHLYVHVETLSGTVKPPVTWNVGVSAISDWSPDAVPDGASLPAGAEVISTQGKRQEQRHLPEPFIVHGVTKDDERGEVIPGVGFYWQDQSPVIKRGPYLAIVLPTISASTGAPNVPVTVDRKIRKNDLDQYMVQSEPQPTNISTQQEYWEWESGGPHQAAAIAVDVRENEREKWMESISLTLWGISGAAGVAAITSFFVKLLREE